MSYTVIISRRAHIELNASFEFYIAERPDLGEKFIDELETSLHKISNTPQFSLLFLIKKTTEGFQ